MKALDVLNPNPRSTLSGRLIFQRIVRSKNAIFPSKKKSQNWVEIKFQRNIWGQLDVRTRMPASKSWNFEPTSAKIRQKIADVGQFAHKNFYVQSVRKKKRPLKVLQTD